MSDRESPWVTLLTGTRRARPGLLDASPDHLVRRHLASRRLGPAAPGPSPGQPAAPRPAFPFPPPNPIAAAPGDGRVLSSPSSCVHEPGTFTEAAAQRSQTGLTGSGSHRYFYGGFGGGRSQFRPHACGRQLDLSNMGGLQRLEAFVLYLSVRGVPAGHRVSPRRFTEAVARVGTAGSCLDTVTAPSRGLARSR